MNTKSEILLRDNGMKEEIIEMQKNLLASAEATRN